ncbi:unnamed protein product, partial [Choristocarpus tenellus]
QIWGGGKDGSRSVGVISIPVPARPLLQHLVGRGKHQQQKVGGSKTSGRTGGLERVTTRGAGSRQMAQSMLRVRRGFGAADLMVGETALLEEMVCAVHVSDACVQRWMDASVEFLLVDGKSKGAGAKGGEGQKGLQGREIRSGSQRLVTQDEGWGLDRKQGPLGLGHHRGSEAPTVDPGDQVVGVARLQLRDVILSPELGVVSTLDLTEVLDFWDVEDARTAAGMGGREGHRGRSGRSLRNPRRRRRQVSRGSVGGESASGDHDRPLILGDRAIGALTVSLELVPAEGDSWTPNTSAATEDEHYSVPAVVEVLRDCGGRNQRGLGQHATIENRQEPGEVSQHVGFETRPVGTATGTGGMIPTLDSTRQFWSHQSGAEVILASVPSHDKSAGGAQVDLGGTQRHKGDASDLSVIQEVKGGVSSGDRGAFGSRLVDAPRAVEQGEDLMGLLREAREVMSCEVVVGLECAVITSGGTSLEGVKVAYSCNQGLVHPSDRVVQHSARGKPILQRSLPSVEGTGGAVALPSSARSFALKHQIVTPAAVTQEVLHMWEDAIQVFEVWGLPTSCELSFETEKEGVGTAGTAPGMRSGVCSEAQGNVLLGLAKVRLSAFASFGKIMGGGTKATATTAADGPILITNPFSGLVVGELTVLLLLREAVSSMLLSAGGEGEGAGAGAGAGTVTSHLEPLQGLKDQGLLEAGKAPKENEEVEEETCEEGWKSKVDRHSEEGAVTKSSSAVPLTLPAYCPSVNDSAEDLSRLLNPKRGEELDSHGQRPRSSPESEKPALGQERTSGEFLGLVRHVVELSAVGKVPLGEGADADDPYGLTGCIVEYSLPGDQTCATSSREGHGDSDLSNRSGNVNCSSLANTGHRAHTLWWDADSAILNSRTRHAVKVKALGGSMTDLGLGSPSLSDQKGDWRGGITTAGDFDHGNEVHEGSGEGELGKLLDCIFGPNNITFLIYWSAGDGTGDGAKMGAGLH